jgi:hypothetical protein
LLCYKTLQGGKDKNVKMHLKVTKADGTVEQYLHTKAIGTISNALSAAGQSDIHVAEELAEVVTYFLYHRQNQQNISSSEILSVMKATLASTGYELAAEALSEHHFERMLKRSRIEVVFVNIQELSDAEQLYQVEKTINRTSWDKAAIVQDLVTKYGLSRQTARAVASMVEEKIFSMGVRLVPASLIKQLVLSDMAAMLRAQRQLQTT